MLHAKVLSRVGSCALKLWFVQGIVGWRNLPNCPSISWKKAHGRRWHYRDGLEGSQAYRHSGSELGSQSLPDGAVCRVRMLSDPHIDSHRQCHKMLIQNRIIFRICNWVRWEAYIYLVRSCLTTQVAKRVMESRLLEWVMYTQYLCGKHFWAIVEKRKPWGEIYFPRWRKYEHNGFITMSTRAYKYFSLIIFARQSNSLKILEHSFELSWEFFFSSFNHIVL